MIPRKNFTLQSVMRMMSTLVSNEYFVCYLHIILIVCIFLFRSSSVIFDCIYLSFCSFSVLDCDPYLNDTKQLITELNKSNGLFQFVRTMREKFEATTCGNMLSLAYFCAATTLDRMTLACYFFVVKVVGGRWNKVSLDPVKKLRVWLLVLV